MLIDLTHIMKNEDNIIQTEAGLDMSTFVLKSGSYPIINKTPVSLTMQNRENQELLISGKAALTVQIPRGRCLDDVEHSFSLDFQKNADIKKQESDRASDSE